MKLNKYKYIELYNTNEMYKIQWNYTMKVIECKWKILEWRKTI